MKEQDMEQQSQTKRHGPHMLSKEARQHLCDRLRALKEEAPQSVPSGIGVLFYTASTTLCMAAITAPAWIHAFGEETYVVSVGVIGAIAVGSGFVLASHRFYRDHQRKWERIEIGERLSIDNIVRGEPLSAPVAQPESSVTPTEPTAPVFLLRKDPGKMPRP